MRWVALLLLLSGCPSAAPIIEKDATLKDSGANDLSVFDSGEAADSGEVVDAGEVADSGGEPEDSGTPDEGFVDTGAPDTGARDCTFGAATTAHLDPRAAMPAERLDLLQLCLADLPGQSAALVDSFLAELTAYGGGAPYTAQGESLVFFRGDASRVTISGSFDSWPSPGQRAFAAIPSSDLWVARVQIGAGERHQYKLTRTDQNGSVEWFTDPLNRWVIWDGIDRNGVGEFNNELFGPNHALTASAIYRFFVTDRDVFLQLPLVHFAASPPQLGVLYVSDGNETLTRAGMQAVVDQTIADARSAPVAVVYVALPSQDIRRDEYSYGTPTANGDRYVAMLADTIAPLVETYFNATTMPEQRGISGASLGGLIAFHAAFERPDVFRSIGAQSASLFWNEEEMIDRVFALPLQPIRIYLDSGSPGDNSVVNQEMADVLDTKGYDYLHIIEPGALHEWSYWAGRFDELLEFLY